MAINIAVQFCSISNHLSKTSKEMKKMLRSLAVMLTAATLFSCSDKDKKDDNPNPGGPGNNTQPEIIDKPVSETRTLTDRVADPAVPDYLVTRDVAVTAQLVVQPGVMVAFEDNARLDINEQGSLVAKGTDEKRIVFTGKRKVRGSWKGIVIYSPNANNLLENVDIQYGGGYVTLNGLKAGLTLFGVGKSKVTINKTKISESGGYGIHAAAGAVLNGFSTNNISNNTEAAIFMTADNLARIDNQTVFSGNGKDVVELGPTIIEGNMETVWDTLQNNVPYRFNGDLTIKSPLRLKPGVIIEMGNDATIDIDAAAYIKAEGTALRPIVIRGAQPVAGHWRGLRSFSTSAANELNYVHISDGGSKALTSTWKANVAVTGQGSRMQIKNCTIARSAGYGIFVSYNSAVNADAATVNSFVANELGTLKHE